MKQIREVSIAIVAGTRPEIIKLAPVYLACKSDSAFKTNLVLTGQHKDMVRPFLDVFGITPEVDLAISYKSGLVGDILGKMIGGLSFEFENLRPDIVLVQGDTSSALAAALAAFHLKIPVGHVEAGLRTNNYMSPFPEEMNRVLISKIASFHFAPTKAAVKNLENEGIREGIFLTGNSGVDALNFVRKNLSRYKIDDQIKNLISSDNKFILSTFHRRENQEDYFSEFLELLLLVADKTEMKIVIPVHISPNVKDTIHARFESEKNIVLLPPVDYPNLIALMNASQAIISDSGGIQEEAPSLGKHIFITRTSTERPEVIESGYGELVDLKSPMKSAERIRDYLFESKSDNKNPNPFGDGTASNQIVKAIAEKFT